MTNSSSILDSLEVTGEFSEDLDAEAFPFFLVGISVY